MQSSCKSPPWVKAVKAHTSQRSKWPEFILVSLAWSMDGMLVHRRVTPQQYVAGTHLYTWVNRDKVEYTCSSLSKETPPRRGLNLEPPDPELEGLTTRPHTPKKKWNNIPQRSHLHFWWTLWMISLQRKTGQLSDSCLQKQRHAN